MTTSEEHAAEERSRSRLARAGSILLWYVLPALAVCTVIAYIAAAIILDVNPPAVPVVGVSMRPTLKAGDLVFLEGVVPSTLRKGDVIAFHVPKASQQQYHLPGSLVHRIVKITHPQGELSFQTKGDANPGKDVFTIHSGDIVGKMVGHIAGLGYPILFFRSTQGEIFLVAAALVAALYFLIGLFEERHEYVAGTTVGLQAILSETEELRRLIGRVEPAAAQRAAGRELDLPPPRATSPPTTPPPPLAELVEEVRSSSEQSRESAETMRELVSAVGEYGQHLRSHTSIMQGLAATTGNLERATSELAEAVSAPPAQSATAQPPAVVPPLESEQPPAAARAYQNLPTLPLRSSRRPQMLNDNILAELREPALERSFRGYAVEPVERLLAQSAAALEDSESDRQQLHARLEATEQQLAHHRQLEEETRQALIAAERNVHELTAQTEASANDREQLHGRLELAEQELGRYRQLEAELKQAQIAAERNARELTSQIEESVREREELRGRLELAEQQLDRYRQLEAELTGARQAAERDAEELTAEIEHRADVLLNELRASAHEIVQQAVQEALAEPPRVPAEPPPVPAEPPPVPAERPPVPAERDPLAGERPAADEPLAADRSLRGVLARARQTWRAAAPRMQSPAPPGPEEPPNWP